MSHETRTHIAERYAVIGPDSHVVAPLAGWRDTEGVVLIAPAMGTAGRGPGFLQYLALLTPESASGPAPAGVERFVYVLEGRAEVAGEPLGVNGYAWLPPGDPRTIRGVEAARLWVHEQRYTPDPDHGLPAAVWGDALAVPSEPFMGDPKAQLAKLLPQNDAFDMEVNRFAFEPGAALPLVESHVNEHGLYMAQGGGIYRLSTGADEHWAPVRAGDAIWMGAFCPQWFGCLGEEPGVYLYSKDVGRSPLSPKAAPA